MRKSDLEVKAFSRKGGEVLVWGSHSLCASQVAGGQAFGAAAKMLRGTPASRRNSSSLGGSR